MLELSNRMAASNKGSRREMQQNRRSLPPPTAQLLLAIIQVDPTGTNGPNNAQDTTSGGKLSGHDIPRTIWYISWCRVSCNVARNRGIGRRFWGTDASSRKYKDNIQPLGDDQIEALLNLQPKQFTFKNTGQASFGFIAEEVVQHLPEIVTRKWLTGDVEGLQYELLVSPLIALVQRQQSQIADIEARLSAVLSKEFNYLNPILSDANHGKREP